MTPVSFVFRKVALGFTARLTRVRIKGCVTVRAGASRYHDRSAELQFGPVRMGCQFLPIGRSALLPPRFRAVVVVSRCARAHLDTTTRNFLPLPARNEWGEGWGEGHSIIVTSSPPPSPPLGEEREKTSASRMVVVSRCARSAPSL